MSVLRIEREGFGGNTWHDASTGRSMCNVRAASSPDGSQSHQRAAACVFVCVFPKLSASPSPPLQPWQRRAWGPAEDAVLSWGEEPRWVAACLPWVPFATQRFKSSAVHCKRQWDDWLATWMVFPFLILFMFLVFFFYRIIRLISLVYIFFNC